MKENKELMDQKITDIGMCVIDCLNDIEFNKVILGFIINKTEESIIKNIELFYENTDNNICYFNELVYNDEFKNTNVEQKCLELQKLLTELYEYCVKCGDEWKYMTLTIESDGTFKIDFKYDSINIVEWRNNNNIKIN